MTAPCARTAGTGLPHELSRPAAHRDHGAGDGLPSEYCLREPRPDADASRGTFPRLGELAAAARRAAAGLIAAAMLPVALAGPVQAQSLESLVERLERLEQENRELRREIEALKAAPSPPVTAAAPGPGTDPPAGPGGLAGTGTDFADRMLDPTRDVNRKDRLALEARRNGTLAPNAFRFHGDITAVANWQSSNRADSFGYLMRHPTAKNQIGKEVSEAAVHSARLAMTATAGDRVIGHAEALFDPGQSFGSGTNTSLERNQLQMRKAWLLFGDLDRSPFHASIGKMAVPFGLTDTFNPFSASSAWHAFGGIANGVKLGYASDRLNLALMGIQC